MAKTVEEEKVQALKDLATKYGTNPNPIIINNPPPHVANTFCYFGEIY